jgi:hypothetical protein
MSYATAASESLHAEIDVGAAIMLIQEIEGDLDGVGTFSPAVVSELLSDSDGSHATDMQ